MKLRDYQERSTVAVAQKLASGKRKVVFQLATGGGKTIIFSAISKRYTDKNEKSVLILVNRKELLQQTRRTLYNAFDMHCQVIVAGMKSVPYAKVYVGMIESTIKRIPGDVGLVIIDEAHNDQFNKIHQYFDEQFIIGFTATPLSANKRRPMKMFYEDIVCGIDIPELIKLGMLCQNITYAPRDTVDRSKLKVRGSDFDEGLMALEFSAPKYIESAVNAYKRWADGTKAIVFNVNIAHSIAVNNAFIIAGYKSKHLDSTMTATERTNVLNWYKNTPGAILNNVGLFTTGFDEPTIETIQVNKATKAMPLWLQMCGRGSRPTDEKSAFTIIDMGGNAVTHGDWCDSRNWEDIFFNPPKKSDKEGVAPCKNCPQCDVIIPAQSKICKYCGYEFPAKEATEEKELNDFVIITKGIDVQAIIEANKEKKEWYPFYKIGRDLAKQAKNTIPKMSDENAIFILDRYHELAKEWANKKGKRYNDWCKTRAKEHLYSELQNNFKNWKPK